MTGQLFDQSPISLPPVVIGDLVAMPAGKGRAYGVVNGLRRGRHGDDRHREIQLLGEIAQGQRQPSFRRGVRAFPALDAEILRAGREAMIVYAQPAAALHPESAGSAHDPACRPASPQTGSWGRISPSSAARAPASRRGGGDPAGAAGRPHPGRARCS